MQNIGNLSVKYVQTTLLKPCDYNPRKWDKEDIAHLKESIKRFGMVDPIICNSAIGRENVIVGGHFRWQVAKEIGFHELPVVYVNIPDLEKEKELNIRLNKNTGKFDLDLLAEFDQSILKDIGFSSEELDEIFDIDITPEIFDLKKELEKLDIKEITIQKGDILQLGDSRLLCGDSTIGTDMLKLMNGEKADMCFTDPPYILDYLKGKTKNKDGVTEGFGAKKNRRYLETDVIPPDFTKKWMANIHQSSKSDFSIIVYENWKNIRTIWNEMEKYWKVKNMIVWHLPNRMQGFSAKNRFFNKHDIAMVGASGNIEMNYENEDSLFENDYQSALYAISGKAHWESYSKGKKFCPTDFIEYKASDEKSSGQGVIFGTKPVEILTPYIKVLTKRNDLIVEPFGGSGSTLIAATKMRRRCYIMEKSPVYASVIVKRWEKLTGLKAKTIS